MYLCGQCMNLEQCLGLICAACVRVLLLYEVTAAAFRSSLVTGCKFKYRSVMNRDESCCDRH